jgi:nitroreductase
MEMNPIDQETLLKLIQSRRTVFPSSYNSKEIEKEIIDMILESAIWAPNHGGTEPWCFVVFQKQAKEHLASFLATAYKNKIAGENFSERKYQNLKTWPAMSPLIIAVCMKPGTNPKIPEFEEARAVSAAIQNMMLMAQSHGIYSYWSTGKLIYSDAFKEYLHLQDEDHVIGLLYFGYSDEKIQSKHRKPFSKKTTWRNEH